jgi:threonine dehydratase
MAGLVMHERLIAEGAGAAGVAALLAGGIDAGTRERRVAIVLSGANVDRDVLQNAIDAWSGP